MGWYKIKLHIQHAANRAPSPLTSGSSAAFMIKVLAIAHLPSNNSVHDSLRGSVLDHQKTQCSHDPSNVRGHFQTIFFLN